MSEQRRCGPQGWQHAHPTNRLTRTPWNSPAPTTRGIHVDRMLRHFAEHARSCESSRRRAGIAGSSSAPTIRSAWRPNRPVASVGARIRSSARFEDKRLFANPTLRSQTAPRKTSTAPDPRSDEDERAERPGAARICEPARGTPKHSARATSLDPSPQRTPDVGFPRFGPISTFWRSTAIQHRESQAMPPSIQSQQAAQTSAPWLRAHYVSRHRTYRSDPTVQSTKPRSLAEERAIRRDPTR